MREYDKSEMKYHVIKIKGNIETVLRTFDKIDDAKGELQKIRDDGKIKNGAYSVIFGFLLKDGSIDIFNRTVIESYCPKVEQFLKNLGVQRYREKQNM